MPLTEEQVRETLKQVIDPELFVNIIDLGLVYTITIAPRKRPPWSNRPAKLSPQRMATPQGPSPHRLAKPLKLRPILAKKRTCSSK